MYQGLTYLGGDNFVGLYGLNETIHDQKAIGLQHLFVDNYEDNLIYTALSYVKINQEVYYGDRIKGVFGHPLRKKANSSYATSNCVFEDIFIYDTIVKHDRVTAYKNKIVLECKVENKSSSIMELEVGGLCITRNGNKNVVRKVDEGFNLEINKKKLFIKTNRVDCTRLSLDSPSEFMYKGIQNILYNENEDKDYIESELPIACSLGEVVSVAPNHAITFSWVLSINDESINFKNDLFQESVDTWMNWLNEGKKTIKPNYLDESNTILVALKAASLNGLLPADLTGHYFANKKVCFYVRDALMASRAFLFSGHYDEFEEILNFLMSCPRKENGEFYQRYNSHGFPDEGANNNVFSQIDVIGYFASAVHDYYVLTKKLIVDYNEYRNVINTLETVQIKNGLYGPEGGVNEGVYGPAYITSTNMFINAGLICAAQIAKFFNHEDDEKKWLKWAKDNHQAIDETFKEENYHYYGYVDYDDQVVKRYDSPQLFGASLGYPISNKYIATYNYLDKYACYFGHGIGYSEQEYHNGPWIFNTCALAEFAYLIDDNHNYRKKCEWLLKHRNDYGMLPEAVDATNEAHSFINPLMWASAEFVVTCYAERLKEVRDYDN